MPNVAVPIWTHAARNPDHPAVRSLDKSWSYEELRSHVAEWAGALREAGLERGDEVGALLGEHKETTSAKHDASEAYEAARLGIENLELSIRNLRNDLDGQR